jgi:hypothetical protein
MRTHLLLKLAHSRGYALTESRDFEVSPSRTAGWSSGSPEVCHSLVFWRALLVMPSTVCLFYKYVALENAASTAEDQAVCQRLGLTGRVRLANEGINGLLAGFCAKVHIFSWDQKCIFFRGIKSAYFFTKNKSAYFFAKTKSTYFFGKIKSAYFYARIKQMHIFSKRPKVHILRLGLKVHIILPRPKVHIFSLGSKVYIF